MKRLKLSLILLLSSIPFANAGEQKVSVQLDKATASQYSTAAFNNSVPMLGSEIQTLNNLSAVVTNTVDALATHFDAMSITKYTGTIQSSAFTNGRANHQSHGTHVTITAGATAPSYLANNPTTDTTQVWKSQKNDATPNVISDTQGSSNLLACSRKLQQIKKYSAHWPHSLIAQFLQKKLPVPKWAAFTRFHHSLFQLWRA